MPYATNCLSCTPTPKSTLSEQQNGLLRRLFDGRKFETIFEEFIEKPLGVGAIAQVYKARLAKDLMIGLENKDSTSEEDKNPELI